MKKNTGFTLIELMIVIAIIAILMSYALPAYRDYTVRAKAAEALNIFSSVKSSIEVHYSKIGTVTGLNNGTFTVLAANDYVGENVLSIAVSNGVSTINFNALDPTLTGQTVTMTPLLPGNGANTGNGLMWQCTTTLTQQTSPC